MRNGKMIGRWKNITAGLVVIAGGCAAGSKVEFVEGTDKIDVKINKIEVASEDPDRFAFNLVDAFQDVANNRSQALNTFKES